MASSNCSVRRERRRGRTCAISVVTLVLCSLGGLAVLPCEASATAYTWSGGSTGDWQTSTNWSPARSVPASDDVLQFDGVAAVTNVPTETIGRLLLSGSSSVTLQAATADNELTVAATGLTGLDVPPGCTLTTGSPGLKLTVGPGAAASIGGTLAVGDAFTNSGTTTVDGTLQLDPGGSLAGTAPAYGSASVLRYSTTGTFGRSVEWSATSGDRCPANVRISNNTTLDLGANGGTGTAWRVSGNLTIDSGSKLGMNEAGHEMTQSLQVLGSVFLSGTLELSSQPNSCDQGDEERYYARGIRVGGDWTSTGGTLSWGNLKRVVIFDGSGTQVVSATATGGEHFPGLLLEKASGTTLELGSDLSVSRQSPCNTVAIRGGDIDLKGHTLALYPSCKRWWVENGNHYIRSTTGPATVLFDAWAGLAMKGNYWIPSPGTLIFGETVTLLFPAGGCVECVLPAWARVDGTLEIDRGMDGCGEGGYPPSYGPNATLRYRVDDASRACYAEWLTALPGGGGPPESGYPADVEFRVTPGHWATWTTAHMSWLLDWPRAMHGTLTIDPGVTFSVDSPVTVEGDANINGGLRFRPDITSNSLSLAGDWRLTGTFTPASHLVTFNGSTPQTITGETTFDKLAVNGAGVSLNDDIAVNQTLTFTSGNITTGAKKVAVGAAGGIARASGHVVGNLQMGVAAGPGVARTFVIGDAGNYTPVDVAFGNVTTAGSLTATTTPGDHPQLGSSDISTTSSVNRYWSFANSGVAFDSYAATFSFQPGDLDPGALPAYFMVGKYGAGSWSYPAVGTRTATSTQATGVTSFSDFALGAPPMENVICDPDPLILKVGSTTGQVAVKYLGGGGGLVYGYSVKFGWDGGKVSTSTLNVTQGSLLSSAGPTMFLKYLSGTNEITVDCALLGAQPGVTGPGTMFTVDFTGVGYGESPVDVTIVAFRDRYNNTLTGFLEDDGQITVDITNPSVTGVHIANLTLTHTDDYAKDLDDLELTATVTDDYPLTTANIRANLSALIVGGGTAVPAQSYMGGIATWTAALAHADLTVPDESKTVTVTVTDGLGNVGTGSDAIIVDNTKPTVVTAFDAAPDHGGCQLSWAMGTDTYLAGVTVRRTTVPGDYPTYAGFKAAWPTNEAEALYPATHALGTEVYIGMGTSATDADTTKTIHYYQAFCYDEARNYGEAAVWPSVSSRDLATSYWLGDVAKTNDHWGFDGLVTVNDINKLAGQYGSIGPWPNYFNRCDVGPVVHPSYSRVGMPYPDNVLQFEDLMIFAMNYGVVAPRIVPFLSEPADEALALSLTELAAGPEGEVNIALRLDGNAAEVKGLSAVIAYDPSQLEFVSARLSEEMTSPLADVFFWSGSTEGKAQVDLAVLGTGVTIGGSGDVAVLTFRTLGGGYALGFDRAVLRGAENEELTADLAGLESQPTLPTVFRLSQNVPNPFNAKTVVAYEVPQASEVAIRVYDVAGKLVRTLVDGTVEPGRYAAVWDGRSDVREAVGSGVYFCVMDAPTYHATHKMMLLK